MARAKASEEQLMRQARIVGPIVAVVGCVIAGITFGPAIGVLVLAAAVMVGAIRDVLGLAARAVR